MGAVCRAEQREAPDLPFQAEEEESEPGVHAARKLIKNFVRVLQDITNPGPLNIDGKALSQPRLKRVDSKYIASVEQMLCALCCRLLGQENPGPLTLEDMLVWAEAASFLAGRIQSSPDSVPGRKPDMSLGAATAMKTVLGQMEAAIMLMSNHKRVVEDITNPGPLKSQLDLKRVDIEHRASVDRMVCELESHMLFGKRMAEPEASEEFVWAEAARYLAKRVQGSPDERPGRPPDMNPNAAAAMRALLAKMEAAHTLMSNHERVIQDITNPGPLNIDGKELSQPELKRVDIKHRESVKEMVRAVCCRLLGKEMVGPTTLEEVLAWAEAARYLSNRVQMSPDERPGREPDMSPRAAVAMKLVLAQIEAAHMLKFNHERVVQDITNPGPLNIDGKTLTQLRLKRVDIEHRASVDAMLREVSCRLLGKRMFEPSTLDEALVWAEAARYLYSRVQATRSEMPGREPDMSLSAAMAMRTVLEQISLRSDHIDAYGRDAAILLISNRSRIVEDITNPGPRNIDGKKLTQLELKRVDMKHQASVDAMLREVCCRLLGKKMLEPSTLEEMVVWAEAARYLSSRVQSSSAEKPGRRPDMSPNAAAAMKTVLAQMEAAHMLTSNRERVVLDITNPGPLNIDGNKLTQLELKRVDMKHKDSVDAMVREVCSRLLGKKMLEPSTSEERLVWAKAARYLSRRIQASPEEKPGRNPDMSADAAAALRIVLAQIIHKHPEMQTPVAQHPEMQVPSATESALTGWDNLHSAYQSFLASAGITPQTFEDLPAIDKLNMRIEFEQKQNLLQS